MKNEIFWEVIKWKQLWRTIWYPTVNIKCYDEKINEWTYKINIIISDIIYKWVWTYRKNINLFEWHIFNFNKNIYWKKIKIIILEKIRENKKINNLDELKKIIESDIKKSKKIKNNVLTFWTFDKLHPWHEYYLKNAKQYWDYLITIVATDKNVFNIKWKFPKNKSKERIENLKKINISDEIILWDEKDPLKWLNIYKPKVVCLWYDQISYSWELKKYILDNNLNIEIIRIKPFRENIYKSSLL